MEFIFVMLNTTIICTHIYSVVLVNTGIVISIYHDENF